MIGSPDSRPSRVLMVTTAGEYGGAEAMMANLAKRLDPARYAPVMAMPERTALAALWERAGFDVAGTPRVRRLRDPIETNRAINGIARIARDRGIDLIHTHGVGAHLHGGLAARRAGRPVISHLHDIFDPTWSRNGLLHRLSLAVPRDATIAASAAIGASMANRMPCEVIPVLVETDLAAPVAHDGPLVLFCGRLQRWKGCDVFLQAAAVVRASRPDVRFAVVGGSLFGMEPEHADELKRMAVELNLGDAVQFVGHVPDARPWMRASEMLVHCTHRPDPFGTVTAEAMIQERAVVAFRHGGVADNVVDGETGRLVPPGDTQSLASAMLELLNDDDRRRAMGRAGRARAVALYSADALTRKIEAVYARVLGSTRPRGRDAGPA